MALTDREIIKQRQVGQAKAYGLAAEPETTVAGMHCRVFVGLKTGTENAITNVAETAMFSVPRKVQAKSVKFINGTNVANSTSAWAYIVVGKSTAGAASVAFATYNTGAAATGGAITKWVPANFILSPNADATLAAGDVVTYTITKDASTGKLIDPGPFVLDLEEV